MKTVEELEAALEAAKRERREAADSVWKLIRESRDFVWCVEWLDKYTVYVSVRYSPAILAAMEEADKLYFNSSKRIDDRNRVWHGMRYILVDRVIVGASGGYAVLNVGSYPKDWRELTQEQADDLRAGRVPDSLKNKYYL